MQFVVEIVIEDLKYEFNQMLYIQMDVCMIFKI